MAIALARADSLKLTFFEERHAEIECYQHRNLTSGRRIQIGNSLLKRMCPLPEQSYLYVCNTPR